VWRRGVFVVARAVDQTADPDIAINRAKNAEAAFLRCLDIRNSREQWVNQLETSPNRYAPRLFSKMAEAEGFKIKALAEAMNRLLDRRMIKIDKASRHRSKSRS
jgi:hypothetical protein